MKAVRALALVSFLTLSVFAATTASAAPLISLQQSRAKLQQVPPAERQFSLDSETKVTRVTAVQGGYRFDYTTTSGQTGSITILGDATGTAARPSWSDIKAGASAVWSQVKNFVSSGASCEVTTTVTETTKPDGTVVKEYKTTTKCKAG